MGHIIDKDGRRPDPERSAAIKNMPAPHNVATLQSFLGLANYYQVFISGMHELRAPLNNLLKKGTKWNWSVECESAFQKIKDTLTSELFLTHFNPQLPVIVASDASSYGIGACILHKMPDGTKKPIAHASRTLLPAEKNYSQIEKESLGIIFAVTRFHRYLHGRRFRLQTDHKPLLTIFGSKKGLPTHTANRLQRWGTILLNYNFDMEFLTSKNLGHADGLSRLIPKYQDQLDDTVIAALRAEKTYKNTLCKVIRELPVTLEEIIQEAEKDEFIIQTKREILEGQTTEAFSICGEVLLYVERVVIPATLQKRILKDFHLGHPGITRMKELMRSFVYWKSMDRDIEETVKACKGCALASKNPPIQHSPWPKAERPWERIHADFAGPLDGWYYLIVIDSYSKWPEVIRTKNPTTETTILALHELFARFGVVDCLVTDNGSQFTSNEFKIFMENFQVKHITIPPYHPRSNGQAERFVDTIKRALKKARGTPTETALQQFLQIYRITPNSNTPSSLPPAEIMFGRRIRSVFDKLLPTQKKLPRNIVVPRKRYNPGEKVYFRKYSNNQMSWELGRIMQRIGNMVYMVEGPSGTHKRHLNQLRKRYSEDSETTPPEPEEVIESFYDTFELEPPQTTPDQRRSLRKRKRTELIEINPKKKCY